jgi:putative phosphoesterase
LPQTAERSIAIISDTHLPRGGRRLPGDCLTRLAAADLIIHAGDLSTPAIWAELGGYGDVVGVRGNVDDAAVGDLLPDRLELEIAGVRLGVHHDGGPAGGRLGRLRRAFPGTDAVIFGHSHIPLRERDESDGFQIFNPGSPTDKRRQPHFTMGWARITGGEISFEIVQLG